MPCGKWDKSIVANKEGPTKKHFTKPAPNPHSAETLKCKWLATVAL